ncbi:putative cytochrome P450 alkane hydroxylase [Kalaharituber pfeilii]|nr:putative cytochrome P450 alkane hydroxylase [Kalaharituber pfeilii]
MYPILTLALAYLIISFVRRLHYQYGLNKFAAEHGALPVKKFPGRLPFGLSFLIELVGNLRQSRFLKGQHERYERIGNTYESNLLGARDIITCEPENIKAILAKQFDEFDLGTRTGKFTPLLGMKGIFVQSQGAGWEHSRALLRPQFHKNQITNDLDSLDFHTKRFLSLLPSDKVFDIQPLLFKLTLDSATEFLFGESTESLLEGNDENAAGTFAKAFETAQYWVSIKMKTGPINKFIGGKKFHEACQTTRQYVSRFVDKALSMDLEEKSTEKSKYVFLEALAKETKDKVELTDQILNILLAGRDTTAGLLSMTLWFLARNRQVWHKLREEVVQRVGANGKPDWELMKDMQYLKNVLNESLRLLPAVPSNGRAARVRTTLPVGGGPDEKSPIVVEKGQRVAYTVYTLHRRKDIYGPDADEFKPERWDTLKPGWGYLPFNGGPRICLGQQYALIEASFVLIRILQQFKDIKGYDPATGQEGLTLTLASGNGVHVKLTPA